MVFDEKLARRYYSDYSLQESPYIIYSTFVPIVLLRSANRTAEILSVITDRTISSSFRRFARITVISDKDRNNFHRQYRKRSETKNLSARFEILQRLDDPKTLRNFRGLRVSRR